MESDYGRVIADLVGKSPTTKTAKIRQLLPEIEAAVAAGVTLKSLAAELNTSGLKVTYHDFRVILSRIRRGQARKSANPIALTSVAARAKPGKELTASAAIHAADPIKAQRDADQKAKFTVENDPKPTDFY
jgi:hypothetical protein